MRRQRPGRAGGRARQDRRRRAAGRLSLTATGDPFRCIVVGLGVQGRKRKRVAGTDCVAAVDPVVAEAEYRDISGIDPDSYDAALLCVPDAEKPALLETLLSAQKHVLVEKPLVAGDDKTLERLASVAAANGILCRTAYNHRFEPHFVSMRELIAGGSLGRIYRVRMFYGNGTARLVRESGWRDRGAGVLPDLGSHLLDTVRFWLGGAERDWRVLSAARFENRAPDHVVIASDGPPQIELEMTLLMWRNHFTCDVLAENGSAHIASLCKWGPATFTVRRRVLPAGIPEEEIVALEQDDPTWALEYEAFRRDCLAGAATDLAGDIALNRTLRRLGAAAIEAAR